MGKGRLEAFSDGVLAIIITIMVLELKVPHGADLEALKPLLPNFLSYVLSFIYVGIYWNNHHHMLHAAKRVTGRVLWANLSLLFWLSLFPFATGWMGENHFEALPSAAYGLVLLMAALSYCLARRSGEQITASRWICRTNCNSLACAMPLAFSSGSNAPRYRCSALNCVSP
jgi:uncharacterized membrane protein